MDELQKMTLAEIGAEISTCQFVMSQAYKFEELANNLRERSGKAYAAGQDKEATLLRRLATEFEAEGRKQRNGKHKERSELRSRLIAELERRDSQEKDASTRSRTT